MGGIELKLSNLHQSLYQFIASPFRLQPLHFSSALRCESDMVASYRVVPYLQCCYARVVTSNAVHNYWKFYINVVTCMCSRFYWYIRTLPQVCSWDPCIYISQTLTAMLQHVTGPAKIDYLNTKNHRFLFSLLYYNLITIYTTTTKSSLLQNLMGLLLQLTRMRYFILNGRY